ncbi:sodium/solute symporter [uncultured Rubinisphaera sp.]|uniref:sodium:solute symporter family transporter n=1 Tax=uncultured Rubinisphaera sp. TaxID=1678686 RepID=UPI0030DA9394
MSITRSLKLFIYLVSIIISNGTHADAQEIGNDKDRENSLLDWQTLPDLPNESGVAGPYVGVHNDALIVAGGANFPAPVWDNSKVWHDRIYVLTRTGSDYEWKDGGTLPRPIAYGAAVSTSEGIVCIGGNDSTATYADVFLLSWNPDTQKISRVDYPELPEPCAGGQAALQGNTIYLAGGQNSQKSAMKNFWTLDLTKKNDPEAFHWNQLDEFPGSPRAYNMTVQQHNGYDDCIYVISGRNQQGETTEFLKDVWEYTPRTGKWRRRADAPRSVMAGTGIGYGQSHLFILGGDDGENFFKADELRDYHPGFQREALSYHTITNTWNSAGRTPMNQVTTIPVMWDNRIVIASGEVRPRVRTSKIWSIAPQSHAKGFGAVNYGVLFGYLLAMVGVGVYFARRNKNTDDYFRGGSHIPWWAAGCSIFATMLSSLTFTGIPSKAFAQDWVYAVGNFMIPVVAFAGVYIALPFYRRLDVTSAYEYLEIRFNRSVRLFGSASFTLFHIFRMAVVMSLTGLALAVATPLTPEQSVLLMGVLSILYCTMGGIEAVIWTDTIQTVVLLGGALLAIILMINGSDGGLSGSAQLAFEADKFRIANFYWDPSSAQIALWVVVVGAIGQNISSYTADQAVVQRYMTTPTEKLAARSIWLNAIMTIPATVLFFGIGTALFTFYHSHPERLDPTITTDQIFPLFIANEMPIGIAGLIVAGIFSAAQSTVSTSMNSTATTIVTDFMRPFNACKTERGYLISARTITFLMGVAGTSLGLIFVDPEIKSLFDAFIKIIGLFMGVLGGLFVLGAMTRRANSFGALAGAFAGTVFMFYLWRFTKINGFLYTASGITVCVTVGYLASFLWIGKKSVPD